MNPLLELIKAHSLGVLFPPLIVMRLAKSFASDFLITQHTFQNWVSTGFAEKASIIGVFLPFNYRLSTSVTWHKTLLERIPKPSIVAIAKTLALKWTVTQFAVAFRIMKLGVSSHIRKQFKVFNSVVAPLGIFVVDDFRFKEPSSKVVRHHQSVFKHESIVMAVRVIMGWHKPVAVPVFMAILLFQHALWYDFGLIKAMENGGIFHG
jgi:hypothetical protein